MTLVMLRMAVAGLGRRLLRAVLLIDGSLRSRFNDFEQLCTFALKKQQQEEVDRILDKIRKSGYDSLTKDEKQKLFDSSKN